MGNRNVLLLTLLLACVSSSLSQSSRQKNPLRILHQWVFANFDYNSTQDRQNAVQLGYLFPGNVAILDGDYFIDPKTHKMRIFVSTPQFLGGIPATFSEVRDQKRDEPLMSPFPSWDAQNMAACSGPTSVYRFFIDKCGLLWVLDSGMVETFLVPRRVCNPKVLIYDLNDNDKLIARYDFPEGVINEQSILITLVTESYQKDCRDSIAYIADVQARGLIMFDWAKRTSWRVENPYFYPFPDHATVRIKNITFELMDGLFGLALSPVDDPQRKLYFHSAASVRESWVLTSVLKNSSFANDGDTLRREFHHSEDIREGQSTVEVMTDDGILIYPVLNKNALGCWNSAQPLTREYQYIIFEDNDNLQFISGMKLKNKTLLITSSKLQNYLLFQANGTDIKYRVMIIDNIDQLLDGSPCRKSQTGSTIHLPVTGGSTQRSYTTTHKPTTSHQIDNKVFAYKPPSDEVGKGQPPFWQPGREQSSHEKEPSKDQIPNRTFFGSHTHSNRPIFDDSKYHPTSNSFNQHWAPDIKSQTSMTVRESTDSKESVRKEKKPSEWSENESRNKHLVFHKPTMVQVPHISPPNKHP